MLRSTRIPSALGLAMLITLFCISAERQLLAASTQRHSQLRPPSEFDHIASRHARSVALFQEAGIVIQDPRCTNCHPRTDRPTQGDDSHPHEPSVTRGRDGHGIPGLECTTCHQSRNIALVGATLRSIPGNGKWGLAPIEARWQGRTLGQICMQIKDPRRNGGRSIEQIYDHMAYDDLVGWAWQPGAGRRPAAGTQAQFGTLLRAWIDSGSACPPA